MWAADWFMGLAPASCIFLFILAFESKYGQDVSMYGYMQILYFLAGILLI
jgi:hypothetical protein